MSKGYAAAGAEAIGHRGCDCTGSGKGLHPIDAVMRVCRAIWPSKTALELAARTGASERTAKYWLARHCDLSAEHLVELICSDAGLDLLEAMMERRGTKPDWWRGFKRQTSIAAARREIEAARARLAKLEGDA